MYNTFVRDELGGYKIMSIRYADILGFYNELVEIKGLKPNTVDNIHTVVHQVLDFAVQNNFLMNNPSDNALRHLKLESKQHTEKTYLAHSCRTTAIHRLYAKAPSV